jgi:hypothetical protein
MENKKQPAFPCMPLQDNLGRMVAPIPGMTKEETVFLNIFCSIIILKDKRIGLPEEKREDIKDAKKYTELYFDYFEKLDNEKNTILF